MPSPSWKLCFAFSDASAIVNFGLKQRSTDGPNENDDFFDGTNDDDGTSSQLPNDNVGLDG